MTNLKFEIEAENWNQVYSIVLKELERNENDSELWYLRGIASYALTDVENDKSKELLASFHQIQNTEGLDLQIEVLKKLLGSKRDYWFRMTDAADHDSRQHGKLDNLTTADLASQKFIGKLGKKRFCDEQAPKILNILNGFNTLVGKFDQKDGDQLSTEIFHPLNHVVHEGFDKTRLYDEMHQQLTNMRTRCLRANPNGNYELGSALGVLFGRSKTGKSEGCYIATAVYGDYSHPVVLDLRTFRDTLLYRYKYGRVFISLYYSISPVLANIIVKSNLLKQLSFWMIVKPVHKFARFLLK